MVSLKYSDMSLSVIYVILQGITYIQLIWNSKRIIDNNATFLAGWFQIRRADAAPSGLHQPIIIIPDYFYSSFTLQIR